MPHLKPRPSSLLFALFQFWPAFLWRNSDRPSVGSYCCSLLRKVSICTSIFSYQVENERRNKMESITNLTCLSTQLTTVENCGQSSHHSLKQSFDWRNRDIVITFANFISGAIIGIKKLSLCQRWFYFPGFARARYQITYKWSMSWVCFCQLTMCNHFQ